MLLKRGLQNNRDPSVSYSVREIEQIFADLLPAEEVSTANAQKLSAVSAAHRIYTNSIAVLPWQVRRKVGENRESPEHYLNYLLKVRPNDYYTPYQTGKIQLSQAFWYGTGYIWIGRGLNGQVSELFPLLTPGHSRVKDPDTGQIWHIFSVPSDYPGGKPLTFRCQESSLLIHHFETYNGYTGVGVLELAADAITADLAAQTYGRKFYRNGARVSGILEVPTDLSEANKISARDSFERMATGPDNAFRTAVMDLGMKYTPLGVNQKDSQYLETRAYTVEEMARVTGIPGYMLQTGKQSYQSNEQQEIDFVINTLTPPVTQMEQEAMRKLLTKKDIDAGWYLKRNMAARLRGDDKSRAEFYEKMWGISALCPDEIRAMEERNPLPHGYGQRFAMSKNYDVVENFGVGKGEQ